MVETFGQDALALYQVPIMHHREGAYVHEKTVTYYAKFRDAEHPERREYDVCLVKDAGDGGEGWHAKMKPVDHVAPNAEPIFEEGLVGFRAEEEDISRLG